MDDSLDRDARAARRTFIRIAHPDRGGDPDKFITGLAALQRAAPIQQPTSQPAQPRVRVVVVPTQRWPRRLAAVLLRRSHRRTEPPRVR